MVLRAHSIPKRVLEGTSTMRTLREHRLLHWLVLIAVVAALNLPNLGTHALWDIDEGLNAEAAREMLERQSWIKPTFNYELRTAKPVMLYWLQMLSFQICGEVNEWTARLPSVLAAMVSVLLTYELARQMGGVGTGLLAGIVLASAIQFSMLARAATPDSVLLAFTVLTYYCYWTYSRDGSRAWFIPTGIAAGLAVLTKGPIGVALPGLVIVMHLLWTGQLRRLLTWHLLLGGGAFLAVALPWYILIAVETKGEYLRQFIGNENVSRFLSPKENHHGPIVYHLGALLVCFAPWSAFLAPTLWYAVRGCRRPPTVGVPMFPQQTGSDTLWNERTDAYRFLLCWFLAYLVFFSIAATKLPNYILPLYPALAILTAQFLQQWRRGEIRPASWVMPAGIMALALTGASVGIGLAVAGGALTIPGLPKFPTLRGLDSFAFVGMIPMAGALLGGILLLLRQPTAVVSVLATGAVLFVGITAAFATVAFDPHKAPRGLVAQAQLRQPHRQIRLAAVGWFQPSVVFYAQREVEKLQTVEQAIDFLSQPEESYLFVPEAGWKQIENLVPVRTRTVAKRYDFYRKLNVIVVTNSAESKDDNRLAYRGQAQPRADLP